MSTESQKANQRRFFRLAYPLSDRPQLLLDGRNYEVSEISERGLRIYCTQTSKFEVGQCVEGVIIFHDGESAKISGTVGRLSDIEVVVVRVEGVTFARMVDEQRHLINKYSPVFGTKR
ncbi:MAG: PilZ domain-containing protein [Planctomycetales bacterium]|nr:PilZ domain-containing protein [Planctomycetales bacterium]